ncbi:hypothetical protein EV665_101620 [Shinella granuli]|uniref:Uncharacterized protein n=1 Tax=Shinella granuli TaxID=323621 RepID=A0A4R2D4M3_SHIGR|nr:hypothetical protein EV665_101620 [Shinella granuli]
MATGPFIPTPGSAHHHRRPHQTGRSHTVLGRPIAMRKPWNARRLSRSPFTGRAVFVLPRQKELYQAAHPETKRGGDRKSESAKSSRQIGDLIEDKVDRFTKTAAIPLILNGTDRCHPLENNRSKIGLSGPRSFAHTHHPTIRSAASRSGQTGRASPRVASTATRKSSASCTALSGAGRDGSPTRGIDSTYPSPRRIKAHPGSTSSPTSAVKVAATRPRA